MVGKTNEASPADDNNKYIFAFSSCCLYVQIGQLNNVLYDEIERMWPKQDIIYFFRRFHLLEQAVDIGKAGIYTNALWSESINPLRIYLFLVPSKAYRNGSYKTNPVIKKYTSTFH